MKKTIILFLLLSVSVSLFSVPASPEPAVITYKDGRSLTVYLRGDESRFWHETKDGLRVEKNAQGVFEYAMPQVLGKSTKSGVVAHDQYLRNDEEINFINSISNDEQFPVTVAQPDIQVNRVSAPGPSSDPFEHTDFPTLGTKKFLLILVEFADNSFTHSATDFDSLMNAKNYTYNNAIGSVNEFYKATSFDRFDPQFDIVGPVKLSQNMEYYGNNSTGNVQQFVYEAIMLADGRVNYADYDNDNDGYVDNIYLIYAGYGECFGGADPNTIWPHRSALYSYHPQLDGKYFYDYSTSMEFYGISGTTRTSIGVVCHEFGHVCGLPDYYDTDYEDSGGNCGGLGGWDAMAGGSWNYSGRRPPIFNAWSRMFLNWAEPVELSSTEAVTLNPAYIDNEVRYFMSATNDEFFMMENRQQSEWDAAIPGHGLLIFHIDKNSNRWNDNSLNCSPTRQAFDLEEADGQGNISDSYINAGDPFPGTSRKTSFLDIGSPNAVDWNGNPSRSPIRSIAETDGIITFNFGDMNIDMPDNVVITAQSEDSVTVSWSLNDDADSVMILWSTSSGIGYPESLRSYDLGEMVSGGEVIYKGIDTVFYHTGLESGTMQYYAIYSFDDSSYTYSDQVSGSAKTASPPFYKTDFSEGLPAGWVIFDRYGNGTFSMDNPENRTIVSTTAENGFMVIDSEHAGDLMIDAELITQSYNFSLSRSVVVSFEHRLEVTSITLARLLFTVNNGFTWYEAARWTQNTTNPLHTVIDLSVDVGGSRDVKFKFNYKGTNQKYWCIDDFEISAAQDTGLSAGFHAATVSGSKPLTVHFLNTSVSKPDTIETYIWELGDASDFSYEKEPVHTYTMSGIYSVFLSVQKNGQISNCIKSNYIEVTNDAPVVINEEDTLNVRKNIANTYNLNQFFMDPNGDPLTYTWSGNSANLDISLQDDSLIVLTPGSEYLGTETITFVAKDNENDSTSHSIDIWVSETGIEGAIPGDFMVSQNYPNPFNPTTAISYQLPAIRKVVLNVYDLNGHKVRSLINGMQDPGYYTINFHAGDLPSGVYIYRLNAGSDVRTMKMILMK
ncbi:MAG: M6 family metalloprotease domain-containing protein [Candidatus Marinimicrobia bacterium]|nr:M6 family metalloprotease domain-containing protein [Candidatus Neomarinimicrobiota bacterium]